MQGDIKAIIENQGNANLDVVMMLIEGDGFTSVNSFPMQLAPSASAEVYVNYTALTTSDVGTATIVSNDPDSTEIAVPLYGGYVGPKLLIEPEALSFDEQMLECYSSERFTLTNIGSETLNLHDVSLEDESGYFEITEPPTSWELEPARWTEVEVSFVPLSDGGFTSAMHVDSNDPDGEQVATVVRGGERVGRRPVHRGGGRAPHRRDIEVILCQVMPAIFFPVRQATLDHCIHIDHDLLQQEHV